MTYGYNERLGIVAGIMLLLVFAAVLITVLSGISHQDEKRVQIVASFLPVYNAAIQVTDGVEGVEVKNLVPPQNGCLHDYQLTPENVIALSKADALIINGAGAESFLGDLHSQYADLKVIDTSEGIALLEGIHHHHHEDEEEEHEEIINEHIWTGPSNYIKQIENLRDQLIRLDPVHAHQYRANAENYIAEIETVKAELAEAASSLPTKNCIIFHDSLAYFARELGFNILASLSTGEESVLSASELAEAVKTAALADKILLIYDDQYHTEYASVAQEASFSRTLRLNMAVASSTQGTDDVWLDAMRANIQILKDTDGD